MVRHIPSLILLSVIFSVISAELSLTQLNQELDNSMAKKCAEEFHVTAEMIMEAKKKQKDDKIDPDENMQCFVLCILKESKALNEDGTLEQDLWKGLVANGTITEECVKNPPVIKECTDIMKAQKCMVMKGTK